MQGTLLHQTLLQRRCMHARPQRQQQQRCARLLRCHASQPQTQRSQEKDPYVEAAYRLQSLINGVGDGEDELYYNMLLEEEPSHKLSIGVVLGAIVMTASSVICWLCDADPAGGASLSLHSLQSAAIGAAAALPLVAYKHASWSSDSHADNHTLSALHKAQTENSKPWLHGMAPLQLAAHLALDTVPILFLMLPAAQAGLTTSFSWTAAALGSSTGLELPQEVGFALALVMTAFVSSAVRSTELMADPEQVAVVGDAVANADRYYRLMASQGGSSSSSDAAQQASTAFKAVAVSWREQEQQVTSLFVTLTSLDFLYLGALWYATGDMTAPVLAALAANAVDYHAMWRAVSPQLAADGGRGLPGGPRQGSTQRE